MKYRKKQLNLFLSHLKDKGLVSSLGFLKKWKSLFNRSSIAVGHNKILMSIIGSRLSECYNCDYNSVRYFGLEHKGVKYIRQIVTDEKPLTEDFPYCVKCVCPIYEIEVSEQGNILGANGKITVMSEACPIGRWSAVENVDTTIPELPSKGCSGCEKLKEQVN